MASDADDLAKISESLRATVRTSFARIYATLKARELKTLRQLDVLKKQCEDDKNLSTNCVQDIKISFDNEPELLDNINKFGAIDLEKLNFDSKTFSLEDYVKPEDDHMYSYKTIEDATNGVSKEDLEIEEAALRQITATDDCVCYVNIRSEDVSQKFRNIDAHKSPTKTSEGIDIDCPEIMQSIDRECPEEEESYSSESEIEHKKLDPTDDWINSIKSQTETEPSQVTDLLEHSTISCS